METLTPIERIWSGLNSLQERGVKAADLRDIRDALREIENSVPAHGGIREEVLRAVDGHTFTPASSITHIATSLGFRGGVIDKAGFLDSLNSILPKG